MLRHPTLASLETLKLTGMATALAEQLEMPDVQRLSFEDRLGLLVDRECTVRNNHRLAPSVSQCGRKSATEGRSLRPCVVGFRRVAGFARNRRPDSAKYAP